MTDRDAGRHLIGDDPLWYKDAIIYELHIRAFSDSNADGIGDFRGLSSKLDYLQDLGVTAVWILPFYPSPLRDDGYDIADYESVNPSYGNLRDVRAFIREAHNRGLRVITELVCNHTSDQHAWFQRARRAKPGSVARDFYVWSDTPDKYRDARIIFKDFEPSNWSWDPVGHAYFWHRFYSHQPDLNFESPHVRKAIVKTMDFWLQMGIDGLRLDAIPYLYEREGTNCENLPETHAYLRELRQHIDARFPGRMLLAEANQWPEDSVAYFGDGDECHMSFHFPVMPRLFMALRMEDRFPIVDILTHTPAIPDSSQWALFLRNHDELTLEMVTDEERDYMYRVYAHDPQMRINLGIRRRLAPLLGNHRRRIELLNGLLFSLPGTPVLYYGDELGMGDNPYLGDRNGVRTPMQWSADRNAGFSQANPQRLYLPVIIDPEYHYQTVNVEAQQNNPHSLFWWTKRLIALRKRYQAFGRGTLEFLHPENRKILAFVRRYGEETILVVANLSRFVQYTELDLSEFRGSTPIELFGQVKFPVVGDGPLFLTLGPHAFFWFALEPQRVDGEIVSPGETAMSLPSLTAAGGWESVLQGSRVTALNRILPSYLQARRWFGGKARQIRTVEVREAVPMRGTQSQAQLALLNVEYTEGDAERYALPLTLASGEQAEQILADNPGAAIARIRGRDGDDGLLIDALADRNFGTSLLESIIGRRRSRGAIGEVVAEPTPALRHMRRATDLALEASAVKAEQSNSSIVFGDRFIMKLFRKVEPGLNPDLEIGRFLTERGYKNTPAFVGVVEYEQPRTQPATLAVLQQFVPNGGDAWRFTLDALGQFYERAATESAPPVEIAAATRTLMDLATESPPEPLEDLLGPYLDSACLLGKRTAELHLTLASGTDRPDFAPEPFSALYQRSLYQAMRSNATQALQLLRRQLSTLPGDAQDMAERLLGQEAALVDRFRAMVGSKFSAMRIRIHGDYHLGQVLRTGDDFIIIDFEGEPARPLSERRLKRSPLRDVAGMLRSFHYAAYAALGEAEARGIVQPSTPSSLEPWARAWHLWVSANFLDAYREVAGSGGFLPPSEDELRTMLDAYLLEKALYELGYELNNRPDWVRIPLQGALQLLGED